MVRTNGHQERQEEALDAHWLDLRTPFVSNIRDFHRRLLGNGCAAGISDSDLG